MFNAMVSPTVCVATNLAAATLVGLSIVKLRRQQAPMRRMAPMMVVCAALIFAAQMLNFSLPGVEASGHLIGGILLATLLGPWAATLTMSAVIALQCLLLGDGGLMALGCNIINMAVIPCMVVYPLLMRPLARRGTVMGLMMGAIIASVVALQLGAASLSLMTALSDSSLPIGQLLSHMQPIHLLIGFAEGAITAVALGLAMRMRADLLGDVNGQTAEAKPSTLTIIAVMALVIALSATLATSQLPDGMEWSMEQVTDLLP